MEGTLELAVREVQSTTVTGDIQSLFEENHGVVFRTAYRITGNSADAEDALQGVFLRLLRRDRSAGPLENAQSYLRRAAVNAALDIVRQRQDSATIPLQDTAPGPQDQRELRDSLRRALGTLNPRAAEVFALRFFEGYSNPEIARLLSMSQMHVAVLLHRTRRQLQKEIKAS